MVKLKVLVVLLLGSCIADITSGNDDVAPFNVNSLDNLKGHHFSQHQATVNAARRGAAERLARISSSSAGNPCVSTICYSNTGFSDSSDAETLGQGIVGFTSGASGSTSSSSSKYQTAHEELNGAVPVYPVAGGSKSSYSSSSHRQSSSSVSSGVPNYIAATDGIKTRFGSSSGLSYGSTSGATLVQPVVASAYPIGQESSQSAHSSANRELYTYPVPVVDTSNAYKTKTNFASSSERQSSSLVQPVPVYSSSDQAARYIASGRQDNYQRYTPSNTYVVYSKPVPVHVYTPVSQNLETSARFANADGTVYQAPVTVVYPSRSSIQHSANEEQQAYSSSVHQPVYSSSSDRASQSASNYRSSSSYQPIHQPVYAGQVAAAERSEESRRHSSVRSGYPEDSTLLRTSAQNERYDDYNRRGSTYVPHGTNSGTVSKYSTYDQEQQHVNAAGSYVPIVPITSDSRYSAQDQRHSTSYNSGTVQPVIGTSASSSSSKYSAEERRQQQIAGGQYYPHGSTNLGSRISSSEAQSAYNRQQSQIGGGYTPYPITNDALGRQFGSAGVSQLGAHADLGGLMTEAERLAKVQAQNAYNGAVSGSSAIDTENRFGGGSDDAVHGGTGQGGYQRTKSWSSSSKWASGQKYGDDGKVKSYSSLSTAESEQHNINGKKTGYKAATSTLEDDGKVSTYSLHTP